ncbi:MAG: hypothetical protein CL535_17405 [Ahrensia sp.]|nr:hypothetical protein [Ahrensia sp.]
MPEEYNSTLGSGPATVAEFLKTDAGCEILFKIECDANDVGISLDSSFEQVFDARDFSEILFELGHLSSIFMSLGDLTKEMIEGLLDHTNARDMAQSSFEEMRRDTRGKDFSDYLKRFRDDFELVCLSERPLPEEFLEELRGFGMPDMLDRRKVRTYRQAYYATRELLKQKIEERRLHG